jgi:ABC-2 type transport system ATP-binding protein
MDEPTVGVDPQSRNHILESVRVLRQNGSTIIYTSHYMEEIQALCDRVVIMDNGLVVADGPLETVLGESGAGRVIVLEFETDEAAQSAAEGIGRGGLVDLDSILLNGGTVTLRIPGESDFRELARKLFELDLDLTSIREDRPTLETVFLNLTGKKLRD